MKKYDAKQKMKIEFRYYTIPEGQYVISMLGDKWEQEYGVGYENTLHFHNYMEIGYCYHGTGQLIIEDRVYGYGENMVSFIPKNIPHVTLSKPKNICKWEFLFIDIDSFVKNEFADSELNTDEVLRIINKRGTLKTMRNHATVGNIVRCIIEECREEKIYYQESIKGYLKALVMELIRLDEERAQAQRKSRVTKYLEDVIKYVDKNYAKDLHISDLAAACGLSESHFRRTFEESMNMKPLDYVNMIRIKKSCELMEDNNLSMEEISYKVGYQTQSTFNRNFKRFKGLSPYKWQKENRGSIDLSDMNISALKGW